MDFIEILKSYIKNEKLNNEVYDKALLKTSIEQSLETILYPATGTLEYLQYYISWVHIQERFYKLQDEITNLFNANNINHIYFKGSILSKLYDDPSVRTRGDIDVYVDNKDMQKAEEILKNNGYQFVEEPSLHHVKYVKDDLEIELHFSLFELDTDKEWISLFKNPFLHSIQIKDSLYALDDTYHFLYCIMHFGHHLRTGESIRYILDFYYMFKKTKIDLVLLHTLLTKLKLERLYSNIINSIRYLSDIDYDPSIEKEDITFFIDYMLTMGIHGNKNDDNLNNAALHKNKGRYFIHKIFVWDKQYRISIYPKMGKHAIWYPLCVLRRIGYYSTHKIGAFFKLIFGKNKNAKMYKKLGV